MSTRVTNLFAWLLSANAIVDCPWPLQIELQPDSLVLSKAATAGFDLLQCCGCSSPVAAAACISTASSAPLHCTAAVPLLGCSLTLTLIAEVAVLGLCIPTYMSLHARCRDRNDQHLSDT